MELHTVHSSDQQLLWVSETNLDANDLYQKEGFVRTDKYETLAKLGNSKLYLMAKDLDKH